MSRRLIARKVRSDFAAKVYRDSEWNEYRVTMSPTDTPQRILATYHADDKEDALATADRMLSDFLCRV